jgi:hypothetical protein
LRSIQARATWTGGIPRSPATLATCSTISRSPALALLEGQVAGEPEPAELPEFFGMLHSGKGDLAARSEEILRTEFGSR